MLCDSNKADRGSSLLQASSLHLRIKDESYPPLLSHAAREVIDDALSGMAAKRMNQSTDDFGQMTPWSGFC
jgi:hypothetical protein